MPEINYFSPKESTTGLIPKPCLVFGNGIEIETVVYAKTTQETSRVAKDGQTIMVLPQRVGPNATGTDIVKVHFVPKTSLAERAHDPEEVAATERGQIKIDAMLGFLSLAQSLAHNQIHIAEHGEDDFYLFADTNPGFAAFLRNRCGFRGTIGGTEVWIKKSEFISDENLNRMIASLRLFEGAVA